MACLGHQAALESLWVPSFLENNENEERSKSGQSNKVERCKDRRKKDSLPHSGTGPCPNFSSRLYADLANMRPLIDKLKDKFTVIAPDLPGIGDSDIPADGSDMKTAAMRIHALAKSLGVEKARVVGHDIGLMVAYAYAAQFPSETEKLVVMDAFLPGVAGWEDVYNNPGIWHFRFNGPTPEALVRGRERIYFDYFWNDFAADKTRSLPEADRAAYAAAYARPGRMRAGWAYFVSFQQAARDFAQLSQTRLTMPVLAIGGEKANGEVLGQQMKLVATDVTFVVLKSTGHWVLEERPKETTDALMKFL